MIILAIIAFIFGLGLIICLHEFGHFIFAKKADILCYEFSIGMGPAIYRKKKGETTYALRCIPIGGYVSMAGEEISNEIVKVGQHIGLNLKDGKVSEILLDETDEHEYFGEVLSLDLYDQEGNGLFIELKIDEESKVFEVLEDAFYVHPSKRGNKDKTWRKMQISPYSRSFESKKLLPRFLSISFGPIMNFILAIVLFFIVGLCVGKPDMSKTVIDEVSGPAATVVDKENGITKLMKNDEILKIEGTSVSNWNELSNKLDEIAGYDEVDFVVKRNGEEINVTVNPIIYIGNLGVCGYTSDVIEEGIPVYLYVTNAKEAGIENGDLIKKVNGVDVKSWSELVNICKELNDGKYEVVVDRPKLDDNGKIIYDESKNIVYVEQNKVLTVEFFEDQVLNGIGIEKISQTIGIAPNTKFDLFYAMGYGFSGTWGALVDVFNTLKLLFSSNQVGVSDLSGPVGIFTLIESSVNQGFVNYIALLGMLSVNIGIINLLPIPALDGGRLVFLAYEAITRKKPNKKVENTLNTIVFILLMALFVYITFNDILRLG